MHGSLILLLKANCTENFWVISELLFITLTILTIQHLLLLSKYACNSGLVCKRCKHTVIFL
jgi:hypothetical protein